MKKCIYCSKTESETTFNKVEHVIPKLLGSFDDSPNETLIDLVCDACNGDVFSPLETRFKEDTDEGILFQMFNFSKSAQVRIRNHKTKTTFVAGIENDFFNDVFPFFEFCDGEQKVMLRPQIKIMKNESGYYVVLLIEALEKLSTNSSKFRSIKNFVSGTPSKNVKIFAPAEFAKDDSGISRGKELLKNLGIDYQEGKQVFAGSPQKNDNRKFEISLQTEIGNDTGRIIAKIAFNYFALCAKSSGYKEVLYLDNFNEVKKYILGVSDKSVRDIIPQLKAEAIIYDEKQAETRFIGHMITFQLENGFVIAQISFLGRMIYKVVIGKAPENLLRDDFGCGHLYDPINGNILGLTQNESKWGSDQKIPFGLFNRI